MVERTWKLKSPLLHKAACLEVALFSRRLKRIEFFSSRLSSFRQSMIYSHSVPSLDA